MWLRVAFGVGVFPRRRLRCHEECHSESNIQEGDRCACAITITRDRRGRRFCTLEYRHKKLALQVGAIDLGRKVNQKWGFQLS